MTTADRVKVRFPLDSDPLGVEAEWMWAKVVEPDLFELDNSPFHAYGISFEDLFKASYSEGAFTFESIVKKAGHRTVRVRLTSSEGHSEFLGIWEPLSAMGCTFEGSQLERPLYSIDVPPTTSLENVIDYLARQEGAGMLEYEEADCF